MTDSPQQINTEEAKSPSDKLESALKANVVEAEKGNKDFGPDHVFNSAITGVSGYADLGKITEQQGKDFIAKTVQEMKRIADQRRNDPLWSNVEERVKNSWEKRTNRKGWLGTSWSPVALEPEPGVTNLPLGDRPKDRV